MGISSQYFAGLFDGEGCFSIYRSSNKGKSRRRTHYYVAWAVVEMRDEVVIDALKDKYGGTKVVKKARKDNHSDTFVWKVGYSALSSFCEDIQPYLIIKNQQSGVILDFLSIRAGKATKPITEQEYEQQDYLMLKLRDLNKTGVSRNVQHRQLIEDNVHN